MSYTPVYGLRVIVGEKERDMAGNPEGMPDYPDVVLGIVIVDCTDPNGLAGFYGELLGRKISHDDGHYVGLEWAPRFGAGLVFQKVEEPTAGKNRVHIDLICSDYAATAARAEELGGKRAPGFEDVGDLAVMLDPEGNHFCLIPPPGA
jgi:predicted enzyme related to lactoylglutathione lyase